MKKQDLINWLKKLPGNPDIVIHPPGSNNWMHLDVKNAKPKTVRQVRQVLKDNLERSGKEQDRTIRSEDEVNDHLKKMGWEYLDGNIYDPEAMLIKHYVQIELLKPYKVRG